MKLYNAPLHLQPFRCDDLIRVGKDNDGGYLVNKLDVLTSTELVSFGIGDDTSFEEQFVNITKCPVVGYDKSAKINNRFFIGDRILVQKNIGITSECIQYSDAVKHKGTFLKCDIEGDEYNIFDSILQNDKLLSGLVIEVHNLNQPGNFNRLTDFISKLSLKLVHIHVNNYFYYKYEDQSIPDIFELTFSSSDNVVIDRTIKLPHALDMVNNPNDGEFTLTF